VVDVSREITHEESDLYKRLSAEAGNKLILVKNKIDTMSCDATILELKNISCQQSLSMAAISGLGFDELCNYIDLSVQQVMQKESPFLLNERHRVALASMRRVLAQVGELLYPHAQFELAAVHLHELLEVFAGMTGRNVAECVLDQIFTSFCLGK
jgi:tRNA U34 5-carboxymethylaminomethyl modifying GTPase MnmE/TrmE